MYPEELNTLICTEQKFHLKVVGNKSEGRVNNVRL